MGTKQCSSGVIRSWGRVIAAAMLDAGAEGGPEVKGLSEVCCERSVFDAAIRRSRATGVLIGVAGTLRA